MGNNSSNTGVIISQVCDYTKTSRLDTFKQWIKKKKAVNHTVCADSHGTGYLLGETKRAMNGYQFSLEVARQGPRVAIRRSGHGEDMGYP